jgi:hypothetical protein
LKIQINPEYLKKLFILYILFSFVGLSCNNEPEPEPEVIRAYCYHFIPELGSVFWEVDDSEVPDEHFYGVQFQGSKENPALLIREIETTHPQAGQVKFQFLHSISGQNSIDLYMGGSTPDKRVVSDLAYLS